jgi:hypothetical protein
MSKQKNVLETVYLSRLDVDSVKSLRRQKAYNYDKGRILVQSFLQNLKLN